MINRKQKFPELIPPLLIFRARIMGELAALELRMQCLIFFFCFLSQTFNRSSVMRKKAREKQQINETDDKAKAAKIKNL
jgi:hypothetical protein